MPATPDNIVLWDERPQDVANLLNPAYMGVLLRRAVVGYVAESDRGMPFSLAFLVPSFVLHEKTRARLPRTVATTLPTWLQENKEIVVDFGHRTRDLVPHTREAMVFLLAKRILNFDDFGNLIGGPESLRGVTRFQRISDTIHEFYRRSEFVGKWLARSGSPTTVFALLGVTP